MLRLNLTPCRAYFNRSKIIIGSRPPAQAWQAARLPHPPLPLLAFVAVVTRARLPRPRVAPSAHARRGLTTDTRLGARAASHHHWPPLGRLRFGDSVSAKEAGKRMREGCVTTNAAFPDIAEFQHGSDSAASYFFIRGQLIQSGRLRTRAFPLICVGCATCYPCLPAPAIGGLAPSTARSPPAAL
jgi:hypothetical protein